MKKYLMTLVCFFFVFSFLSCEKEENLYNVPAFQETVLNDKANVITATSAEIRMSEGKLSDTLQNGQVKKYDYYLRYSLSPDMSEPSEEISLATRYVKGAFGYEYKVHYFGLTNLTPNTTYYYKVYVKGCGDLQFGSSVKSFTTSSSLKISKVTYTDWDGTVKELKDTIGVALTNYKNYGNFAYQKDGKWLLNDIVSEDDVKNIAFYYPYFPGQTVSNALLNYNSSMEFVYNDNYQDYAKFIYRGEVVDSHDGEISIHFKPASVRVRFHIYYDSSSDVKALYPYCMALKTLDGQYAFRGELNLETGSWEGNGVTLNELYFGNRAVDIANNSLDVNCSFVPTHNEIIKLSFWVSYIGYVYGRNKYVDIKLNSDGWKEGNTYDYNVYCLMKNGLYSFSVVDVTNGTSGTISDVSVKEWDKNESGDLNIYD